MPVPLYDDGYVDYFDLPPSESGANGTDLYFNAETNALANDTSWLDQYPMGSWDQFGGRPDALPPSNVNQTYDGLDLNKYPSLAYLNQLYGGALTQDYGAPPGYQAQFEAQQQAEQEARIAREEKASRAAYNRENRIQYEEPDLWTRTILGLGEAGAGMGRALGGLEEAVTPPSWQDYISGPETPELPPAQGMIKSGTIKNLFDRPILRNPDGSISTTSSISIGTDEGETLIPTVINGRRLTNEQAIEHFRQTGEHLGIFDTVEHADAYAQALHNAQEKYVDAKQQEGNPIITGFLAGAGGGGRLRKAASKEMADLASLTEHPGSPTTGDYYQKGVEMLGGMVPLVAGGLPAMAAQVFGNTFASSKEANLAKGLTEGQAQARAYLPAVISGALSYLIWNQFGPSGARALENGITPADVSVLLERIATGAGATMSASALDTLSQNIVAKLSYEPDKPITDIITDTITSGATGALLGAGTEAGVGGLRLGLNRLRRGATRPQEPQVQPPAIPDAATEQFLQDQARIERLNQQAGGSNAITQGPFTERLRVQRQNTNGRLQGQGTNRQLTPEEQAASVAAGTSDQLPVEAGTLKKGLLYDAQLENDANTPVGEQQRFVPSTPESKAHAWNWWEELQDGQIVEDVDGQRWIVIKRKGKDSSGRTKGTIEQIGEDGKGNGYELSGNDLASILERSRLHQVFETPLTQINPPREVPIEPGAPARPTIPEQPIGNYVGRPVRYQGYDGTLAREGDNFVVQLADGRVVDVPSEGITPQTTPADIGIEAQPIRRVQLQPDGGLIIDGVAHTDPRINLDQDGNVVSLTAKRGNKTVTIRDRDAALDAGIQLANQRAEARTTKDPSTVQQLEQAVDQAHREFDPQSAYGQLNPIVDVVDEALQRLGQPVTGDATEAVRDLNSRLTPENLRVAKNSLRYVAEQIALAQPEGATNLVEPLFDLISRIEKYEQGTSISDQSKTGSTPQGETVPDTTTVRPGETPTTATSKPVETKPGYPIAHLPKALQKLAHDPRVKEVWSETGTGDGYWVALNEGYADMEFDPYNPFTTVHEWKVSDILRRMKGVKPRVEGSLAIGDGVTGAGQSTTPSTAFTVKDFITQIANSNLSDQAKAMFRYAAELPILKDLDWQGLMFRLTGQERPGGVFDSAVVDRGLEFSDFAKGEDLVHEVSHILERSLPKEFQDRLEQLRQEALKEKYGDNIPPELQSGTMTSQQFVESGLPPDAYRYINAGEFLAHTISDRFAREFAEKTAGKPFVKKITDWFKGVWDAFARAVSEKSANRQQREREMEGIYKQFINGEIKPDVDSLSPELRGSLSKTAEDARTREELAVTPERIQEEGWHQLAQSTDILRLLANAGATTVSKAAQKALNLAEYVGINKVGRRMHGAVRDYRQLRNALPDDLAKGNMAVVVARQFRRFGETLAEANRLFQKQDKKVKGAGFQRLKAWEQNREYQKNIAEVTNNASGPYLESALKDAYAALKDENASDLDIARTEGRIKQLENAQRSPHALAQVTDDITAKLAATTTGQQMLADPALFNRVDIREEYKDIKRKAGEPLHEEGLINVAVDMLRKNDALREDLLAQQLARNSSVRAAMGPYQTKILADMEKNPVKTIMRERKLAQKLQSVEDKARYTWLKLNEKVLKEEDKLKELQEAHDVAQKVQANPDYRKLKAEVYRDAGVEGEKASFIPGQDKVMVLPDGSKVNFDLGGLRNKLTPQQEVEWKTAQSKLQNWLNDPANRDDPNFEVHLRDLNTLNRNFIQESVFSPHDRDNVFSSGLDSLFRTVRNVGGHLGSVVNKSLTKWGRLKQHAAIWLDNIRPDLVLNRLKSMRASGYEHNKSGGAEDLTTVNSRFYKDHLNWIAASRNKTGGLKLGELAPDGRPVTQADLDEIASQSAHVSKAWDVIKNFFQGENDFLTDDASGYTMQRRGRKGTADYVPRTFNKDLDAFVLAFDKATKAGDTAEQVRLLNEYWEDSKMGHSFIADRDPDFVKQATPFDGQNGAFQKTRAAMEADPSKFPDFDSTVNYIESITALPRDLVESILLRDFGDIMGKLASTKEAPEEMNLAQLPVTGEKASAFTRGRGEALAPYAFYEYGFKDSGSAANFASMLHANMIRQVVGGFVAMQKNIEQRKIDLRRTIEKLARAGVKNPQKTALKQRQMEKANGDNYDLFNKLDEREKEVKSAIDFLTKSQPIDESDTTFARTIGAVTGGLVGNSLTTVRNITEGPKYVAQVMQAMQMRPLAMTGPRLVQAMWHLYFDGLAKGLFSGSKSMAKAALAGSIPAALKSIKAFTSAENKGRRTTSAIAQFEPLFTEMGVRAYERQKEVAEMQKEGITRVEPIGKQFQARLLAGVRNLGELREHGLTGKQKAVQSIPAALESLLLPIKTVFPILGEHALNVGIKRALMDGHVGEIKDALNKIADAQLKSGYRNFDFDNPESPINALSAKELWPGFLGKFRNDNNVESLKTMYQEAGLDFQTEYMKYLKDRIVNGIKNPQYLSEGSSGHLLDHFLNILNKPSQVHQPFAISGRGSVAAAMRPLLGWNARTLNTINDMLSVPAKLKNRVANMSEYERAKARQYMWLAASTIVPMLGAYAANGILSTYVSKKIKKALWDQIDSQRYPWEKEGAGKQALAWGIQATYGIPFVDKIMNSLLSDQQARASLDPSFVMVNKFKDLLGYLNGAAQTGDPTFRLPQLVESFFPDSRGLLNRIPSETGKRIGADVVALGRRFGPQDLVKESSIPTIPHYSELSPYAQRLENAALNGDMDQFQQIYDEAVAQAEKLDKKEPEKLIKQLFMARNPLTRAFNHKLTDEQYNDFLDKLDPGDRQKVESAVDNFRQAADSIGAKFTATEEERKSGTGGGGATSRTLGPATTTTTRSGQSALGPLPSLRTRSRLSGGIGFGALPTTTGTLRRGTGTRLGRLRAPRAASARLGRRSTRLSRSRLRRSRR